MANSKNNSVLSEEKCSECGNVTYYSPRVTYYDDQNKAYKLYKCKDGHKNKLYSDDLPKIENAIDISKRHEDHKDKN